LGATRSAVLPPILALLNAILSPGDADDRPRPDAKPIPWGEAIQNLYRVATGWLGWTPETAWSATPAEITEATAGHVERLVAIHGTADDDHDSAGPSEAQRAANAAAGLDPDFDRDRLHALASG